MKPPAKKNPEPARRVRRPGAPTDKQPDKHPDSRTKRLNRLHKQMDRHGCSLSHQTVATHAIGVLVKNQEHWARYGTRFYDDDMPVPVGIPACERHAEKLMKLTGAWIMLDLTNTGKTDPLYSYPLWYEGRIWLYGPNPLQADRFRGGTERILRKQIELANAIYRGDKWWNPKPATVTRTPADHDLAYALEHQGWALIYSRRLEDEIIVVRNTEVKVPPKYGKLIRYTMEELIRIGELGRGPRLSLGELSSVHLVKSLGGTVVQ